MEKQSNNDATKTQEQSEKEHKIDNLPHEDVGPTLDQPPADEAEKSLISTAPKKNLVQGTSDSRILAASIVSSTTPDKTKAQPKTSGAFPAEKINGTKKKRAGKSRPNMSLNNSWDEVEKHCLSLSQDQTLDRIKCQYLQLAERDKSYAKIANINDSLRSRISELEGEIARLGSDNTFNYRLRTRLERECDRLTKFNKKLQVISNKNTYHIQFIACYNF